MLFGKAKSEQTAFPEEAWLTCLEQHSPYHGRWPNSGTAHFCPPALHLLGLPRDKGHLTVQLLFLPGNSDKSTGTGRMGILIIGTDEDGPVGLSHHAPSHTQYCHLSDGLGVLRGKGPQELRPPFFIASP